MLPTLLAVAIVSMRRACLCSLRSRDDVLWSSPVVSLQNSQGAINHSLQPLALTALAQWGVAGYFVVRKYFSQAPAFASGHRESQRRLIHAAKVALVSCCHLSLYQAGAQRWPLDPRTPNLAVAIARTNTKSISISGNNRSTWP
jgi:hypothetical protein